MRPELRRAALAATACGGQNTPCNVITHFSCGVAFPTRGFSRCTGSVSMGMLVVWGRRERARPATCPMHLLAAGSADSAGVFGG